MMTFTLIKFFSGFYTTNPKLHFTMNKSFLFLLLIVMSVSGTCLAQSDQASNVFKADTAHSSHYNLYGNQFPRIEADSKQPPMHLIRPVSRASPTFLRLQPMNFNHGDAAFTNLHNFYSKTK
jgi:hypothetical protein